MIPSPILSAPTDNQNHSLGSCCPNRNNFQEKYSVLSKAPGSLETKYTSYLWPKVTSEELRLSCRTPDRMNSDPLLNLSHHDPIMPFKVSH